MSQERWKLRLTAPSARAVYLHLPFCEKKCAYCDFASWATRSDDPLMSAYTIALQHLVEQAASVGLLQETKTAYLGGGTPSMVGTPLSWLCETVSRHAEIRELTVEANPESLTEPLVDQLISQGATRFSVGVQSLSDRELLRLGRIHNSEKALDALALACKTGAHVSCDLMCAIPLQTLASWQNSLEGALATGIDHISIYPLIIEEGTALARQIALGQEAEPDPDVQAQLMEHAEKILGTAGFERYEVASYARVGASCRHNVSYWSGEPYLGIGTSAAGMLTRSGWERLRLIAPQLPQAPATCSRVRYTVQSSRREIAQDQGWQALRITGEFLTENQATAEDLMLSARKSSGISPSHYEYAVGQLGDKLTSCVDALLKRGLLARGYKQDLGKVAADKNLSNAQDLRTWLYPTHQGWLLGNELYGALWDLAEGSVRTFLSACRAANLW